MARSPFVPPETVRLSLREGDWLEVKKYLNHGEQKALEGAGLVAVKPSSDSSDRAAFELDFRRLGMATLNAYIVDWSFVDASGKPTKPTPENIAALDSETAKELDEALAAHRKQMESEKNGPKPSPAGEPR